ncbi:DNA polymerase I [Candidatus Parcubacteria bacterium]|nr:DNA polymerase I [Patescibacteria group bacterium]MCG2693969.1 DNA polymerase I [Candidatus Parcubacteria bacterium]
MKKLIIIDGNALLHRAFHAIRPLSDPQGRIVNAVFGFARVLQKIIKDFEPDFLVVCWDRREKTFRHEACEEYKAQREAKPQDLYDQIPIIKEMLDAYSIPHYDKVGYEADDLIGTIAKSYEKKVDKVLIVTGDMDMLQLVDDKINVVGFIKGVSETKVYDVEAVKERYGLLPKQIIDLKALMGDPSDNIKGVQGIGKVGASKLVQEYGSVDGIYDSLEKGKLDASEKVKDVLRAGKKDAYKSRGLVEIIKDVPIEMTLKDMEFGDYSTEAVDDFFVELGFRSLLSRTSAKSEKPETGVQNIFSKEKVKQLIKDIEKSDELGFLIIEGQEGLFGKEVQELWLSFGGRYIKITFGALKSKEVFDELAPIFQNEKIKKISHDIKSGMHILASYGVELRGVYFDTMLAAYILNSGTRRYDIETLCMEYLKKRPGETLLFDVVNLKNLFFEKLKKEKLERVFFDIEMPLLSVLFKMEEAGIKIDKKLLSGLSADFEKRLVEIDKKIYKLAGEEFNISSPQQLQVILYEKLGLKPKGGRIKRGKTGLSTAASELAKLLGRHEIIEFIMEHRELTKLKNTYIDTLPKQTDKSDRVHTTFNQTITSTGRLSSSEPNVQNIPIRTELGRGIRKAFIADSGYVLASLDYSQIELRLAAALAGEKNMIKAFERGDDIHRETAAEVFNVKPEDVTKEMRRKAKAVNFGVLYGMGVQGLGRSIKSSMAEAQDFLDRYYSSHPAIMEYIERTKALAYKTGYVETIFGRRRYLPEIKSYIEPVRAAAERMAINMPIQGTAADIIKMAMIELDKNVVEDDVRMVLQVHDELVFEIKKGKEKKAVSAIKEVMEHIYKLTVPLEVEVEVGGSWE